MGLLDKFKSLLFGKGDVSEGTQDEKPVASKQEPVASKQEEPVSAKIEAPVTKAEPADMKVEQKPIIQKPKEEKPVADKITVGHVHMSGCTGCLVSLADNYEGLLTILDKYADLVYCLTLADVRHIPEMDVALVEGSVCLNDECSMEEILETREKAKIVVALGGCACYGNTTRFCRGGQQNQPQHEAFLPIGDLIKVDVYIPACAPTPQQIRNVCLMAYLLLKGNDEQKALATAYLTPLMNLAAAGTEACGCDLMTEVINQGLCCGCGSCAAACTVRAITMQYGRPQIERDLCIKCGACYAQCPRSFFSFDVCGQYEAITNLIGEVMKP
ncbi:MAG TPA: coenzyme F420 hydrogenase subunit gamma [Methanocorpusculum sp.]|nr:coenzyme F420 hydrogenase subunit gamma [Methanocorpusculum sp.]HJK18530.1 coenzyme F420 hydrogenase subunit gamma [Methanocorpusculum sp.]HJK21757.1 coenzyme F420 hydrogenase subunit gamma [Methanocorpusculum sp.]HJK26238.1 coenzyme F420 hydrogenase subunit gamma [Methanocorpusculum sp.]HJK29517.1 coenzyme F420 hydrogenase subunit gamma [Methanocorpusculum sp.]